MRREQQVIDRPREMMPDAYYNDALVQAAAHSAMYAGMESFRYGHIDKGTCLRRMAELFSTFQRALQEDNARLRQEVIRLRMLVVEPMPFGEVPR
jgi:hypothetical protein